MGHRDISSVIFSVVLLFFLFPSNHCLTIYNLTQYQSLYVGDTLVSPGKTIELGFFIPKNSSNRYLGIWYVGISPKTVVWVANRERPLQNTDAQASLTIGSLGNLELLGGNNMSVWSTDVGAPTNNSVAILSDNGNFQLNDGKSGDSLWQSFDHLGDTLLPGAVIGFNVKTNASYVLTSWKSENDPSPGTFVAGISYQRPPEAFIWINESIPYWRSGPWDKSKFTGIPEMNTLYGSPFELIEDIEKGTTYLHFNQYEDSTVANLFVSSGGVLKIMERNERGGMYASWEAPVGKCEVYGVCGPFSACKDSESRICKCLKGFVPKSSPEWNNGDWTGGCRRRRQLFCEKSTNSSASRKGKRDGFWKIRNVKLPDFYEFVKLVYSDAASCQIRCLNNCSCSAYAYVTGIGCLVWSEDLIDIQVFSFGGEDLFVRLAHEELGGGKTNITVISIVVTFTLVIICAIAFGLQRWKAKQKEKAGQIKETTEHFVLNHTIDSARDILQFSEQRDHTELPIFNFGALLVATNHFSPTNKLGQGGFGSVYKGKLQDGKEIAVKRLSSSSGQGVQEFKNEIILISKLQHRNLVKLLGYCIEKEEKLLVYEFMPNKSLDIFIFDPSRSAQLNWATRFNIIQSVARGLVYLHRDSCLRVIHRDLKASNILLDEKMNPKISDFGLARMFQGSLDLANTKRVVGTLGYMSPEYAMGGIFSEKSDVFSFGVLILEIVSGKKNSNFHYSDQHMSLIAYAWHLWSENRELDFVDEALAGSYSEQEAKCSIHVGLLCAQDHAADRPSMPDIALMLSNETNRPKPKQPIFTLQSLPKYDFQSQHDSRLTVNEATMSLIEGR